ncbi:MAG: hypothetical protein UFP03_06235 [Paludibacteraceae bacterium]|nr:hypothetical protein [Paludibacteraceae bacterium]
MLNVTTRIDKLETIEEIKTLMGAVASIREYFGLSRQAFALLCDIPPHSYRVLEKHGKGDLVSLYKLLTTLRKRFSIDLNILLSTKKYSIEMLTAEHDALKKQILQEIEVLSSFTDSEKVQKNNLLRNDAGLKD